MSDTSRVRVYLGCSFDGCIAGPDHDIDWLNEPAPEGSPSLDDSEALGFHDFMAQIGSMLMGRATYAIPEQYGVWHYGDIPVLVATNRPLTPMVPTVQAVSGDIRDLVARAKELAGEKDVYLDGGNLVRQALEADLVDELCLTFLPVVLGDGIRLFDGLTRRSDWTFVAHTTHGHMVQVVARRRTETPA